MAFQDRQDAGRRLAAALAHFKGQQPVILALPRGGLPVAGEVAERLTAPLHLVLVRKMGVPEQPNSRWVPSPGGAIGGGALSQVTDENVRQALARHAHVAA